ILPIFLSKAVPPSLPGGQDKPSLSAWLSPVVPLGGNVTLQCHFHLPYVIFKIFKIGVTHVTELQGGFFKNNFTMSPVTTAHAGHRLGNIPFHLLLLLQSANSHPLCVFTKPSISAHPGSLVHAGGTVTLHCHSELAYDTFILLKEGDTKHSQQFVEELPDRHTQAHFSMGPMTSAHTGTYKCYGSVSHSPNEWSVPSDPLDMAITMVPSNTLGHRDTLASPCSISL
uniref:Immunoglobulin-like beta-sandwich domain-containing protein n=1 Tax=Equus asinus TaxID=9793 RepID=A0A8C4PUP7_EQUAS